MELSAEDALRLNVLLANPLEAVRIDESSMTVYALSEQGEASVSLNPRGRDDQYLKKVRELLSSQVLGSPGGYPVFLRRWTRMGQARDHSLEQLLLLGEPEAVVAPPASATRSRGGPGGPCRWPTTPVACWSGSASSKAPWGRCWPNT